MTKQRIKRRYGERTHTKRILAVCFTGFVFGLLVCRGGDAAFSKTVMGISATVDAAAFTAALLMGIWLPGIVVANIGFLASGFAFGAYIKCVLSGGLMLAAFEHGGALAAAGTGVLIAIFRGSFMLLLTDTGSVGTALWRTNLGRRRSGRKIDLERGYAEFIKRRLLFAALTAAVRAICMFCIYDPIGI